MLLMDTSCHPAWMPPPRLCYNVGDLPKAIIHGLAHDENRSWIKPIMYFRYLYYLYYLSQLYVFPTSLLFFYTDWWATSMKILCIQLIWSMSRRFYLLHIKNLDKNQMASSRIKISNLFGIPQIYFFDWLKSWCFKSRRKLK